MKHKLISVMLALALLILAACGQTPSTPPDQSPAPESGPVEEGPLEGQEVSIEDVFGSLLVTIPEGWEYELMEELGTIAVRFWPEDREGAVTLYCHDSPFGVCGTGLESVEKELSDGRTVTVGTFDGGAVWDFITFDAKEGHYVAMTEPEVESWWKDQGDTAMQILTEAQLGVEKPTEKP